MIDQLENGLNRLSDQDWSWWPLLAIRPDIHEQISSAILLRLTATFGVIAAVLLVLLMMIYQLPVTPLRVLFALLIGCGAYLLIFGCSFHWAWNRRAVRLSQSAGEL